MPKVTPRRQLEDRVRVKFLDMGMPASGAARTATEAVDAFYAEDRTHHHWQLVTNEALQVMLEAMPPFVSGMRAALEAVQQATRGVARAAAAVAPYTHMVELVKEQGPSEVAELTEREWHVNLARRLMELGCTYADLKRMAEASDFATHQHQALWVTIRGTVNPRELARAYFVLSTADHSQAFNDGTPPSADHPEDRITGAPHHIVINGDHSTCGCGGDHLIECGIWNDPHWQHKGSICGIPRTLCNHHPRHRYGQPCEDYAADSPQAAGRPQGCVAHGGPDCVCEVGDAQADG